jgi:16S rRNA (adenine1518-N6/adenine1519-N6)-dimethyltransferase
MSGRSSARWGQHFLVNPSIRDFIVSLAELSAKDVVLEIGVGTGFLTEALAKSGARVIGIEKDPKLLEQAAVLLGNFDNVFLHCFDVLELDLDFLLQRFSKDNIKLVSNLPYYLSTEIITRVLFCNVDWQLAVLMVQREFAEKTFLGIPRRKRGPLSVIVPFIVEVQGMWPVPRSAFRPMPRVDSVIVKLCFKREKLDKPLLDKLWRIAQCLFAERRKKVGTVLKRCFPQLSPRIILNELGLENARAEDLSPADWLSLIKALPAMEKGSGE